MKRKTKSIPKDLALKVLLVFGVSCVFLAMICIISASNSIKKMKNEKYEQTAELQAQKMSEWFNTQEKLLDELALSVHSSGYDTERFDEAVDYLADIIKVDSNIYAIYMGREDKSSV